MSIEEQIRREYEAGATYRQLAKKYRKSFSQIADIVNPERKAKADKRLAALEDRLSKLERIVDEAQAFKRALQGLLDTSRGARKSEVDEIEERLDALEDLFVRFVSEVRSGAALKRDNYRYFGGDGYCHYWYWSRRVEKWDMKEDEVGGRKVYRLNVIAHVWYCIACPGFTWKLR
ncbi:MAG: hypothetical protein QW290_07010 [Sulfolobales archaeon]